MDDEPQPMGHYIFFSSPVSSSGEKRSLLLQHTLVHYVKTLVTPKWRKCCIGIKKIPKDRLTKFSKHFETQNLLSVSDLSVHYCDNQFQLLYSLATYMSELIYINYIHNKIYRQRFKEI